MKNFSTVTMTRYSQRHAKTSCVLPLALWPLAPDDMKAKIFAHIVVDKIEDETHGHIGTGLIGGQYLNRVLSTNGMAAPICVTPSRHAERLSKLGLYGGTGRATTIWELWNGANTADPTMNSANHVMLIGDLVASGFTKTSPASAPTTRIPASSTSS